MKEITLAVRVSIQSMWQISFGSISPIHLSITHSLPLSHHRIWPIVMIWTWLTSNFIAITCIRRFRRWKQSSWILIKGQGVSDDDVCSMCRCEWYDDVSRPSITLIVAFFGVGYHSFRGLNSIIFLILEQFMYSWELSTRSTTLWCACKRRNCLTKASIWWFRWTMSSTIPTTRYPMRWDRVSTHIRRWLNDTHTHHVSPASTHNSWDVWENLINSILNFFLINFSLRKFFDEFLPSHWFLAFHTPQQSVEKKEAWRWWFSASLDDWDFFSRGLKINYLTKYINLWANMSSRCLFSINRCEKYVWINIAC